MGAKFDFGNAAQELKQVHAMMAMAYNDNNYAADVVRAKQMEAILRKLKHTNLAVENGNSNNLESIFDGKPYSAVAFNFGPDEPNYYIIDEDLFIELKTYLESK